MISEEYYGKIKITKGNNLTIFEFNSDLFFNQLLFIKEIDTIFPELYLLSDCIDELIAGKKSFLNKLLIRGDNSNNPSSYSKIFKICDGIWNKLNKMIEPPIFEKEDKLLEDRVEFYKQYGIEILKTKEEQKSIYEEVKKEYNFDDPKKFFESLQTKLFQIDFPEDKRRKIERILCDLEGIKLSEDEVPYTPTKEEVFMTIEAIIEKKCTANKLEKINFIDKDQIPSSFEGMELSKIIPYSDYDDLDDLIIRSKAIQYVELKFRMNNMEKKMEIINNISNWFDSKSICFLWLIDILFETNCLTEYINELINKASLYESKTYCYVQSVYSSFTTGIKSLKNYERHKMRWEFKRKQQYEEKKIEVAEKNVNTINIDLEEQV